MKKRITSLLLAVCMAISVIPNTAYAEESMGQTDNGLWAYEKQGNDVVLTNYYGTATDVYVPNVVEIDKKEYDVVKLGNGIFEDNDNISSVTLGENIKEIGDKAFYDADNMVCVLTSEELTSIGDEAFYSCDNFNSIILYDAIQNIGVNAFVECSKLTVWCNGGTAGYIYVTENNIPYEILNPEAIPETVIVEGNKYYINNGTARLMLVEKKDVIVIPAYVQSVPVTTINNDAFSNIGCSEVYIPDTVTFIQDGLTINSQSIFYCGEESAFKQFCDENYYQCVVLNNNALPEIITVDDYTYYIFDNQFAAVKSYTGSDAVVTVPAEINGVPITKIYSKAFTDLANVEEIVLPDTIDMLNTYSFYNCRNLTTINIPEKVEIMPSYTFYGCSSLANVQMNQNVKYFGERVFGYSNQLSALELPESLKYVKSLALADTYIMEITYPKNAFVEDKAFYNNNIVKVIIPDGLSEFNHLAFKSGNYDDVHPVYYLSSSTELVEYCEENGLMYHVGDSSSFEPYEYSDYMDVYDEELGYSVGYEVIYKVFDTYAVLSNAYFNYYDYINEENVYRAITDYEIPSDVDGRPVTMIQDYAFSCNGSLSKIIIPDTVSYIGRYAFERCENLKEVKLSGNITVINDYTFYSCTSLESVELPESITRIGEYSFANCAIETIVFPEGLQSIGQQAFYGSGLKEVVYPNCEVGNYAFGDCQNLREVTITNGVTTLTNRVFQACANLEYAHIPTSVTFIDQYTFNNCTKVMLVSEGMHGTYAFEFAQNNGLLYSTSFWYQYTNPMEYTQDGVKYYLTTLYYNSLGNTATVIGHDNISGDISLPKTLTINGTTYTVRRIGAGAFAGAGITSIDLPDSITVFGDNAFSRTQIKDIKLPEKVSYFGVNLFNATKIEEFTFPTNYDLNFGVFAYTSALKKVHIPEGVKVIPEYAFHSASNIEEIILPESIELIKRYALCQSAVKYEQLVIPGNAKMEEDSIYGLVGLKRLILNEGITTIPRNFRYLSTLKLVYLPKSVLSIDYDAFENCNQAIFCVYEDSYSHEYCDKKGLPYFILGKRENPEILYGTEVAGVVTYSNGTPASNTTVDILYEDGTVKETVTTDANGAYKFTYAEVGKYAIRATSNSGYTTSQNISVKRMNVFDVFLAGDTDLTIKQGYSVSGTVNENNATITLTDEAGNVLKSVTTEKGKFEIENVSNGTYILKAESDNGFVSKEITVYNDDILDLELTITTETATIYGIVEVEDREGKCHRRNWVNVAIYNEEGNIVGQCKTDKDGKYQFVNLPLGEYSIVAESTEMRPDKKHGYDRSYTLTGYAYVDAAEKGVYQIDTIILYEESDLKTTVSGKITANGEHQACDVILRNVFRYEVASQTTGKNGKYSFKNVCDGLYFITAITESDGMGFAVVVVRNGDVYGETDIKVLKNSKVKALEEAFFNDVPECERHEDVLQYRERIAQEKNHYDALSKKEKNQLSKDYIKRLNQYCEWLANCEYVTSEGVLVEQGGLVVAGTELQEEDTITFNLSVEKKTKHELNGEGVKSNEDYLQHSMEDAAQKQHDYGILEYYEISMTKKQGDKEQTITSVYKDTEATGTFRITIDIPEEYRGYKHYSFIHVHKGEVVTLVDLDENPNTVTLEVNAFSTFALLATNEEKNGRLGISDLNGDGQLTEKDIAIMRKHLVIENESLDFVITDINEDNEVDIRDLVALKREKSDL